MKPAKYPAPDALGAMLRGRQVIVVGDSKQMPPNNLFGKAVELEEEELENSATAESFGSNDSGEINSVL
ncbi:hypothetical protein [Alishewanella longhuensis]